MRAPAQWSAAEASVASWRFFPMISTAGGFMPARIEGGAAQRCRDTLKD
jgi:hypothetical protein